MTCTFMTRFRQIKVCRYFLPFIAQISELLGPRKVILNAQRWVNLSHALHGDVTWPEVDVCTSFDILRACHYKSLIKQNYHGIAIITLIKRELNGKDQGSGDVSQHVDVMVMAWYHVYGIRNCGQTKHLSKHPSSGYGSKLKVGYTDV